MKKNKYGISLLLFIILQQAAISQNVVALNYDTFLKNVLDVTNALLVQLQLLEEEVYQLSFPINGLIFCILLGYITSGLSSQYTQSDKCVWFTNSLGGIWLKKSIPKFGRHAILRHNKGENKN